jgi:hypothetical protein
MLDHNRAIALDLLKDTFVGVIGAVAAVTPYESTILVAFFPSGDSVRMVVTLSRMHDKAFTNVQQMGFTTQLTKLDSYGVTQG